MLPPGDYREVDDGQQNQYVFEVALDADKALIKEAVETLFKVEVTKVNTLRRKGKQKVFKGSSAAAATSSRRL